MLQLVQGESRDLVFTASSIAALPDGSPIKANGLQTEGYRLFFYAKFRLDDADEQAAISKSSPSNGITIESSTVARVSLTPSDTQSIVMVPGKRSLLLYAGLRFRNVAGTVVYLPVAIEQIELLNAV